MKLSKIYFSIAFILVFNFINSLESRAQTMVQWYTSMGDFNVQLREDLVPITAQNFIDLTNSGFYDGLLFHRVIPNFMIQDGCPIGDGTGGPGYSFDDEFHPDLRHNEAGILSMANSGPNTNGSQYFVTVAPTTWLNDLHAVFGKVIDGLDVVIAISEVETNSSDRPLVDVVIDSIRVITMGTKSLELTSPVTGDYFLVDKEQMINWNSEFVADVNIEFSSDNGVSWQTLADSISCNAKSFIWETPTTYLTECKIRISDATNPALFDESGTFSLGGLDLISPFMGAYFGGDELEIVWESVGFPFVGIEYQDTINGDWVLIEDNIPADNGSYSWMVPEVGSSKYKLKVFVSNTPSAYDISTGYFRICLLDLLSPTGGEEIVAGGFFDIEWSSDYIYRLVLEYSTDNGDNWNEIVPEVFASDSSYQWLIPSVSSQNCFVKAYYKGKPELYRMNAAPFSINWPLSVDDINSELEFNFNVSPNPVSNNLSIDYSLDMEVDNFNISICDLSGKMMKSIVNKSHIQGSYNLEYNMESLIPGVYLLVVNADGKIYSRKIVKK